MVLYQSIMMAVRHIAKMPTRLTESWTAIPESYSESTKCPSADSKMPRQKISSDCWPQSTSGLAAGEFSHTFALAAEDLKRLIDKTRFAISTEETRYYLNGIYLHAAQRGKEQTLRAVATDGHRLAQAELARACLTVFCSASQIRK